MANEETADEKDPESSGPSFKVTDKRGRKKEDSSREASADEASADDASADEASADEASADDPSADEDVEEEINGTVLGDEAGVHVGSVEEPKEPPIDFGNFVMSLAHSALVALGQVEHPESGEKSLDLPTARHTIQILEMLQEKTRENLEPEEERLLRSLLYDLRTSFVDAAAQRVET